MPFADLRRRPWRDPLAVLAPHAQAPHAALLLSDGGPRARWSYLALEPEEVVTLGPGEVGDIAEALRALLGPWTPGLAGGPPFQGGVIGLWAYEAGARLAPIPLARDADWPDAVMARHAAVLAFDHHRREVVAIGSGADPRLAARALDQAVGWLEAAHDLAPLLDAPLAEAFGPEGSGEAYESAVAETVARIGAGELYQANIARAWRGRLAEGATPFALLRRLTGLSPAPFGAYLRLPGAALVSHSPERFLGLDAVSRQVEARPIKGTRARDPDATRDAALARDLLASVKDRAENLMIVDLMRNDLARVCAPGTVEAPTLFAMESYAQVHHLVSTVRGRLAEGRDAADLLAATFPPGSITGAPKRAAMQRIAALEPPRGPWCGSLFWAGFDGGLDSSVLIRTAALVEAPDGRWDVRACAGAGIVADSDAASERAETETKIEGLRRALRERP